MWYSDTTEIKWFLAEFKLNPKLGTISNQTTRENKAIQMCSKGSIIRLSKGLYGTSDFKF